MPTSEFFELEVEFVLDSPPKRVVVGHATTPAPKAWSVGKSTTLGGRSVQALVIPPRALHPDGSPRLDLVALQLATRTNCSFFKRGDRVRVEGLVLPPASIDLLIPDDAWKATADAIRARMSEGLTLQAALRAVWHEGATSLMTLLHALTKGCGLDTRDAARTLARELPASDY